MIDYKPKPIDEPKVKLEVIENTIKQNDNIYALFLESSALEGYLSSLLIISRISNVEADKGLLIS